MDSRRLLSSDVIMLQGCADHACPKKGELHLLWSLSASLSDCVKTPTKSQNVNFYYSLGDPGQDLQ